MFELNSTINRGMECLPGGGPDELSEVLLGKMRLLHVQMVGHLDPLPVDPLNRFSGGEANLM